MLADNGSKLSRLRVVRMTPCSRASRKLSVRPSDLVPRNALVLKNLERISGMGQPETEPTILPFGMEPDAKANGLAKE